MTSVLADPRRREGRLMDDDRAPARRSQIRIRVYETDTANDRQREVSRTAAGVDRRTAIPEPAPLHWPPCYCPQHPEGKVIA